MNSLKLIFTQIFRLIFTWWHNQTLGTMLHTFRRGQLVGADDQGNKYYVDKKGQSINGKTRRWVIYNGDVEASRVPAEWHGWLHYTVDETPLEVASDRKKWQKPHQINQTGLKAADKPDSSLLDGNSTQQADSSTYEAWHPSKASK